ncbi:hypothetical protein GGX14DRAFT_559684 [Mycena pura]|uniref:Uncharacterized protein n=1 Tax=Mycena pura TaxID=153505 RepID=A0AAD6VS12_9AGAR|nr:hypothetical protein GGX14DRAFT_559684 [Mycena pura]
MSPIFALHSTAGRRIPDFLSTNNEKAAIDGDPSQVVEDDDDKPFTDWSSSETGQADSVDTLSTDAPRTRTPPLVTRSKAKKSLQPESSTPSVSPAKSLSTKSVSGSLLKPARGGPSIGVEFGTVPVDTQRKLQVVATEKPEMPSTPSTVTISSAEYAALVAARDNLVVSANASFPSIPPQPDVSLNDASKPPTSALLSPADAVHEASPKLVHVMNVAHKRKLSDAVSTIPDFLQPPSTASQASSSSVTGGRVHDENVVLRVKTLPPACEVSFIALQDVPCRHTYTDLPNLRKGTFVSWSSTPGEGLMLMSALPAVCKNLNAGALWSAFTFGRKGRHVNLSRVDPRLLQAIAPVATGEPAKFTLCIDGRTAVCVSVCVIEESVLSVGLAKGNSRRQKFVSGILFSQDFQRLVAVCCMVFEKDSLHAPLAQDAITFGSALEPKQTSSSPVKRARVAAGSRIASSSTISSASYATNTDILRFDDKVPVYDGRSLEGDFENHLDRFSSTLPAYEEHDGELLPGSVVAIGYTVNQYKGKKGPSVGFNINWVVILGEPRQQ